MSDPGSNSGYGPFPRPRMGRSRPSYPAMCEPLCGSSCCGPSATPETPAPIVLRRRTLALATETAAASSAADGGVVIPVLKPRTHGKHLVEHRTRLDPDNDETLYACAAFVGEEPDDVINQLVETVLAKDKELRSWRAAHAHSHAPRQCGARSTQAGTRSQCAAAAHLRHRRTTALGRRQTDNQRSDDAAMRERSWRTRNQPGHSAPTRYARRTLGEALDSILVSTDFGDVTPHQTNVVLPGTLSGHQRPQCGAVLGAVKASSLRSDTAFRGASDLDRACAQRVASVCLMAGCSMSAPVANQ